MKKGSSIISKDEISMDTIAKENDEVELVTDIEQIEEMSEQAKKMQEKVLLAARERAMAIIDRKKIPEALKEIEAFEMYSALSNDYEVMEKVKENISTPMDLKFLEEAKSKKLQNIQTLLKMDSVNTNQNAGEIMVGVEFVSSGGGTTKVVVGKK